MSVEAYADRQMQRYDRRLLKVRTRQNLAPSHYLTARYEQLARRIIRRRDAHMMQFIAVLSPETYR